MQIVECSRCKGKGFGTWRVDLGRCFKCLGTGLVKRYTQAERVAAYIVAQQDLMDEIENRALRIKTDRAVREQRRAAKAAKAGRTYVYKVNIQHEAQLDDMRAAWVAAAQRVRDAKLSGRLPAVHRDWQPCTIATRKMVNSQQGGQ